MKSFKTFLTESSFRQLDLPDFLKLVVSDCKPFWRQMEENYLNDDFLWRGITNDIEEFAYNNVRENRQPRDTNDVFHKLLDDFLNEQFGFKYRSKGLFVTRNIEDASNYGDQVIVFPAGTVTACWSSKVSDVYDSFFSSSNKHIICLSRDLKLSHDDIIQTFKKFGLYLPIDETWENDYESYWEEFGTFRTAMRLIDPNRAQFGSIDVEKKLNLTEEELADRFIKYCKTFLFPKFEYEEGSILDAFKKSDGSEIMIDCSGYYMISRYSLDDDGHLEQKIKDRLKIGFENDNI